MKKRTEGIDYRLDDKATKVLEIMALPGQRGRRWTSEEMAVAVGLTGNPAWEALLMLWAVMLVERDTSEQTHYYWLAE